MKKHLLIISLFATILTASAASASTRISPCADTDTICKEFEGYIDAEQPEKVLARYRPSMNYSDQAQAFVGSAYLAMASQDNITPEQEESYYRKALEVKHTIAYMGLYFLYAQKDEAKALGFLRAYVATKPANTVPYVILGESELDAGNYALAASYLREGKKVAHAYSPRVDWLLFMTKYMLKDYAGAAVLFESAVMKGGFEKGLKELVSDPRFADIGKRPEFIKYEDLLKTAKNVR